MAFEVISTHLTAQYIIHGGDYVYVQKDASVVTPATSLLGNNDSSMSVHIDGTVVSANTAVNLGASATVVTDLLLQIGETGVVSSLYGSSGIYIGRTNAEITNHGHVSADWRGLYFAAGATSGSLKNTGTITANSSYAVYASGDFNSNGGAFEIENSGYISGGSAAIKINSQGLELYNSGTLIGNIGVGSSSNISNSNSIDINNSGSIIGRNGIGVQSAGAGDSVINSGRIVGDVDLAGGRDLYDGRGGTVEGEVYGGLGNDTYIIDDASIELVEQFAEGTDTVQSSVSWKLGANFEDLTLIGDGNIRGVGNDEVNIITGNDADNRLRGRAGYDTLNGGDGNDEIRGGKGNDVLLGGAGDDILRGNTSRDTMDGGDGHDRLIGGKGKDEMTGGDGEDVFVFNRVNHSLPGVESDKVTDFVAGVDQIDFSGLNMELSFIGTAVFTNTVGEVRLRVTAAKTSVRVDTDGDGVADIRIELNGASGLEASDFIL
ncbi:MAG: hypothetical protein KUG74_11910 [Rhodobacteraceae bacterium]|nr:hypothetical protein [Paracoccaceae bacterium]